MAKRSGPDRTMMSGGKAGQELRYEVESTPDLEIPGLLTSLRDVLGLRFRSSLMSRFVWIGSAVIAVGKTRIDDSQTGGFRPRHEIAARTDLRNIRK